MLVLASRSPQRRAILEQLGIPFRVRVPEVDELYEGEPCELVRENAWRKARAVRGDAVLGVDTAVVLDGCPFGKPADRDEAADMLSRLSGREHEVLSGLALRGPGGDRGAVEATRVCFRRLGERERHWYLDTGEWRGRAGGYAIQSRGAALVERISGDYLNVVGLPVATLLSLAPELLWG